MHLSRDLLLVVDILIFVKVINEMILCIAFWNASAEGTCNLLKVRREEVAMERVRGDCLFQIIFEMV